MPMPPYDDISNWLSAWHERNDRASTLDAVIAALEQYPTMAGQTNIMKVTEEEFVTACREAFLAAKLRPEDDAAQFIFLKVVVHMRRHNIAAPDATAEILSLRAQLAAARDAALEEAALFSEQTGASWSAAGHDSNAEATARTIASRIRALKGPRP